MSNSDTFDPTDESWLEMPLVISPLQAVDPTEIVEIEDDSASSESARRGGFEDIPAEDEEEEEEKEEEEEEDEEEEEEGDQAEERGAVADTSKVNKFFLKLCKGKPSLEEVILSFSEKERDAPSILRYKPTYQRFIRQKGKKPADEDKPAKKAKVAKQTRQEEKSEEVPEDSFGPLPECLLSSSYRPLRGQIREARDEATDEEGEEIEMSPRNIIADLEERKKKKDEARAKAKTGSSAGGPTVRSAKAKSSSIQIPDSPAGKRPLSSTSQGKDLPKDTRLEKKQRIDTGSGGEGETTKGKGVSGSAVPWSPLFVTLAPEKRQITNEDSLAADPSIARVLFHGLALPKDIIKPASLKSAIDDHYFHAGRLDDSETERGKLAEQVTNLNEMVKQLTGATEQARAEGKKEMEKEMKEEMEKEKQKVFDDGYSKGYNKAGDELVDQVEQAEEFIKQHQHVESYTLGYCKALDDAGVAADDPRRTSVAVPSLAELDAEEENQEEVADENLAPEDATENVAEGSNAEANATATETIVTPEA
ncbi:hypothetical protein RHGRI_029253 [Rhododendron griersonianum]|uniref:Uncharacterized protein n=1 Tax=Rhododendron griersonianum TaxID=479676 RepID=A0AAV6IJF4_9ERIC|nr:hypothetical protein RHGRI_029253 [Rhododendron griersonianum]